MKIFSDDDKVQLSLAYMNRVRESHLAGLKPMMSPDDIFLNKSLSDQTEPSVYYIYNSFFDGQLNERINIIKACIIKEKYIHQNEDKTIEVTGKSESARHLEIKYKDGFMEFSYAFLKLKEKVDSINE